MAFINLKLFSDSLNRAAEVNVIIPENNRGRIPVLYLLHGLSGDYGIWMRMTSIERYVEKMGIAVVMPDGGRSFYTDMQNGANYQKYVSKNSGRKSAQC
jgi:S-formylglutathione hydrolase FrmB